MNKDLFELINKFDVITIYRHVSPDSDALGSQFGLKQWILDTYPNKQVYALGINEKKSIDYFYPEMDYANDETIKQSLAIILDTANSERIDDQRFKLAKYRLKIDHHVLVESYADTEIVCEESGATCEILARLFMENEEKLSSQCAQYLYCGLIADTLRFSIASTSSDTLKAAAYLVQCGADVVEANKVIFSTSLKQFKFENFIRSNCNVKNGKLAYMIVRKEDYERFGLTFEEAKEKVFVMGGINEFEMWVLFTEKEKDENGNAIFNGSLRSKKEAINDIANKYHGGGHKLACGVKGLTEDTIQQLLTDLVLRIS